MIGAAREGGWARVVVVFQPHRYTRTAALWRDFADAFAGADLVVLTDVYAVQRAAPARRLGPPRPARGARRAPRPARRLPPAPRRPRRARAAPRPARRRRAHARRRRPHHRCPTSGWRSTHDRRGHRPRRSRSNWRAALRRRGRARRRRSPPSPPTASAARSPSLVRVRPPDALAAARGGGARSTRRRCSSSGRGSNLLVADRGFPGVGAWCSTGDFEQSTLDAGAGRRCGPAPRSRCPCWPAGRGGRVGRASSSTSGIPGSVGGAVRMNAGGHGRETAEVLCEARDRRPRPVRVHGRSTQPRRPRLRATAARRSGRRGRDRRRLRGRRRRPGRGVRGRRRRDRALAPGAPARRRQRRLGVPRTRPATRPGRLIDAAGPQGAPGRRGGRVAEARQLLPGRAGRHRRRRAPAGAARCGAGSRDATGVALVPELRLVGFDDAAVSAKTSSRRRRAADRAARAGATPRRRQRWIAARRRRGRRRRRIVVARGRHRRRAGRRGVGRRSVSPLLDVDHIVVRGQRAGSPRPRSSRRPAASSDGDPLVWLDVERGRGGDRGAPVGPRARTSSVSGRDTVRSRCTERRPPAWVDGRRGTALGRRHRPRARAPSTDTAGRAAAARRRRSSSRPSGGDRSSPSTRRARRGRAARVRAPGTSVDRRAPTGWRRARGWRAGPEIRLGEPTRSRRRRCAPRSRCSARVRRRAA